MYKLIVERLQKVFLDNFLWKFIVQGDSWARVGNWPNFEIKLIAFWSTCNSVNCLNKNFRCREWIKKRRFILPLTDKDFKWSFKISIKTETLIGSPFRKLNAIFQFGTSWENELCNNFRRHDSNSTKSNNVFIMAEQIS